MLVGVVGQVDAAGVGFVADGVAGVDHDLAEVTVLTEHVLSPQILLRGRLVGNADDVDQVLLNHPDHLEIVSVLFLTPTEHLRTSLGSVRLVSSFGFSSGFLGITNSP